MALTRSSALRTEARQEACAVLPASGAKEPDETVRSVIRTLSDKFGEQLTTHLRAMTVSRTSSRKSARRASV
ncbi:MAG: hypothetical protein QOE55_3845 [Acidobacteriaceae bacterium]|jgi:hypothetical protein|nr:hypothetical protein [Acidobacteriaceae bacterium]